MFTLWTEKYRPQKFFEMKGQEKIVERVAAMVTQKNLPNLLLAGPPGVGKSTLALVIAHELFGEGWEQNFLELNASDSRGIETIRGIIKDFARTKALGDVPYKIIFLDECDNLTKDAQQALRRTMENFTHNVRFILSCNYSSKIMDPILSRCTVFRFQPLDFKALDQLIVDIATKENLIIDDLAKKALIELCEGDCRKVANMLQSCAALDSTITEDIVYSLVSAARPQEIKLVLDHAIQGQFLKSRELLLDTMLKYGLSGLDVIKQIQKEIWNLTLPDRTKLHLIETCGEIEFRMVEGSDEFVQLEALLSSCCLSQAA